MGIVVANRKLESRLSTRQLIVILTLCAFGLRLLLLGSKSLWLDEVNGMRVALVGQASLWAGQSEGYHPPLYYWLLERWLSFGDSEFTLRMSSVLAGVGSVWVGSLLGMAWFGRKVALTATALLAVSPILVWYSQELRPYTLMGLLGLIIMLAATKLLTEKSLPYALLLIASMTAILYLHYFGFLFIPLQLFLFVILLAAGRTTWQALPRLLVAMGLSIVAYWPWLQSEGAARFFSIMTGGNSYVSNLLRQHFGIASESSLLVLLAIAGGSIGIGLPLSYKVAQWLFAENRLVSLQKNQRWQWMLIWLFVLSLVVFVFPRAYSLKRQLAAFWPLALIVVAWFWPWEERFSRTLTTLLALSLCATLINTVLIPKPQWRQANALIAATQQPNDIVILEPAYMTIPFNYYNQDRVQQAGLRFGSDAATLQQTIRENERVWLITHGTDYDSSDQNARWLAENSRLVSTYNFYRLQVRLFEIDR